MIYTDILNNIGEEKEVVRAFVVKPLEKLEITTEMKLMAPNTYGNTIVKVVVMDGGKLELNGLIKIGKDAVGANAFLRQNVLLLGENSLAVARPELEIETDNVKASHAMTVGQLNEEELFYLQSRGITKKKAVKILTKAFFAEILDRVSEDDRQNILDYFKSNK
jgi:Fe-S cluster assembly protein SufD